VAGSRPVVTGVAGCDGLASAAGGFGVRSVLEGGEVEMALDVMREGTHGSRVTDSAQAAW